MSVYSLAAQEGISQLTSQSSSQASKLHFRDNDAHFDRLWKVREGLITEFQPYQAMRTCAYDAAISTQGMPYAFKRIFFISPPSLSWLGSNTESDVSIEVLTSWTPRYAFFERMNSRRLPNHVKVEYRAGKDSLRSVLDDIVEANRGLLITALNYPIRRRPYLRERYFDEGYFAMIEAIESFDPKKGIFSQHAYNRIKNRIHDVASEDLGMDRETLVRAERVRGIERAFKSEYGFLPGIGELSRLSGYEENTVTAHLLRTGPVSLDAMHLITGHSFHNRLASDIDVARDAMQNDCMDILDTMLSDLTPRQRDVVRRHFLEGVELLELSREFGSSKQAIHDSKDRALRRLREHPLYDTLKESFVEMS